MACFSFQKDLERRYEEIVMVSWVFVTVVEGRWTKGGPVVVVKHHERRHGGIAPATGSL